MDFLSAATTRAYKFRDDAAPASMENALCTWMTCSGELQDSESQCRDIGRISVRCRLVSHLSSVHFLFYRMRENDAIRLGIRCEMIVAPDRVELFAHNGFRA